MTIEEAAALAKLPSPEARVVYKPGDLDQRGTVMAVSYPDVFVRFDGETTSTAVRPGDLAAIGPEEPGQREAQQGSLPIGDHHG